MNEPKLTPSEEVRAAIREGVSAVAANSATTIGWRATATASYRANFIAPWLPSVGLASPCRRNMAAPVSALLRLRSL